METKGNELIKKMPFSLEAEQSVLGSILIDPECFSEIATILKSEDFYLESHAEIYLAMQDLFLQSRTIDVVTLIDTLVKRGVYESDDEGKKYVKLIAEVVPSAANVRDYAKIVHNKRILRRMIEVSAEISEAAYAEQEDVDALLDSAQQRFFDIAENHETKGFTHIREALLANYEHLKLLKTDKKAASGQPTGFSDLDRVLVGMGPGDLILVGARPGMGKTSFTMNVATKVAQLGGKTVCVFSLEMSAEQLVSRMLSSEALIDSYAIRSGNLTNEDWEKLARASSMLSECEILIDDTAGISAGGMRAKLRRVKNLGLIVVDYLQLMQTDNRHDSRVNEVGEISRNLKLLAKDLKVPIICCAQLSRGPESRTDKRPMLSDLRDSGTIEQDADIVMFLYRDEYYDTADKKEGIQNTAEIIVAKNRHGSTANVKMGWFGQFTKFTSLSERSE
ncbi:MAG: replicative DNA helicase [Ruminococcaceae bacterium]|nr:replicative DNA helicase [Oscillospiraceae bacterium]